MSFIKRILTISMSAVIASSILVGCSSKGNEQVKENTAQTRNKEEIVFAAFRPMDNYNPHLYSGEMWMQEMVYETLVSVEDTGIEPCLAESWEISEDGKTYTFKIREGVTFTDGEVCDANAIKANFDAIWDNIGRHVWMESANLITEYNALDDYTFEIKLSAPYEPMLLELGVTRPYAICSPNAMKDGTTKDGVTAAIGSGPYKLIEDKVGEYAVFEANENYWGEQPEIKKVVMKVIPDNQTRVMALENGEIDLIYGAELLDAETLNAYSDDDEIISSTSEPSSTRHLIMNSQNEILKDKNVRYAISHAINKEAISEGIFHGIEAPAHTLYSKEMPYCGEVELSPFQYDTELAKKYLEEAGWKEGSNGIREKDGQKLSLRILYDNNSVTGKTISEYIQAELQNIGIALELEGLERQTYFDALKAGDFDIAHNIAWGSPYDPQSALSAMRGPVYGDYAAQKNLENKEELDNKITQVFVEVDEAKRQQLYNEILTMLHESAIYIPLTFENNKSLYTSDLQGVEYKPSLYTIPFWEMSFK